MDGTALVKLRRIPEAVASLKRAVAIEPNFAAVRRTLGDLFSNEEMTKPRSARLLAATHIDPEDEIARYFLAAARHESPAAPPPAYVSKLFDECRPDLEHHLVDILQYRAPEQVCAAVLELAGPRAADWQVIDLGCGTGLCGPLKSGMLPVA